MKTLTLAVFLFAMSSFGTTVTVNYQGNPNIFNNLHVGPANATIDGNPNTIFCIEFDQYISVGETWVAEKTPVIANTPAARAAWLFEQMKIYPTQIGDIQFAVWNLTYSPAPDTTLSNQWLTSSVNMNPLGNWYQLSHPTKQDFLVQEMPEPTTYLLMGVGLLFFGFKKR